MLLVAWVIYGIVLLKIKNLNINNAFYFLSFLSLILENILVEYGINYNPFILYFFGILFANIDLKKNKITGLLFFYYLLLLFLSFHFYHSVFAQQILNAFAILGLFILLFFSKFKVDIRIVALFLFSLIVANFIHHELFLIVNLFIPVFLLISSIDDVFIRNKQELENFKIKIAKTIDNEVKREIEKLEIKLQLAYKKLKEIFKLNSYTIKEISIEEMADKVVKGLLELGYTGSVLELEKYGILKKEGYIPNFKNYVEEVFREVKNIEILDDGKFVIIPIFIENEKFGTLSVYSRNEIIPEEVEYLLTYGKSIATAIAKVDYFIQIIKLRDLIYTAVDSINIPLVIADTDLKVEIANRAFSILTKSEDIFGKNVLDVLPSIRQFRERIESVVIEKRPAEWTFDGNGYIYDIRIYPVLSENKVMSMVFIIEDITDKENMERQIIQSEKLAVIGRLAAGISHEIKNPLSIISQSAFSLKRKIAKNCDKDIVQDMIEPLERIERSSYRAKDIIDRLLNFAKPYYNKIERVNLKEVIEESIKLAVFQTNRSEIKIYPRLKDVYTKGDKNSLIQLFLNIIINALESIVSTGRVSISLTYLKRKNMAKISIKDTGTGISNQVLDKIFEPFFTTKEKGTGLGLSVAYRIVKDHNGDIVVKSEEGKGSEFIIYLPIYEEIDGE